MTSRSIGAGEVIALVGENGSGKTTLAKLVAGLYSPDHGHVRWDGRDVGKLDAEDVRRRVAVIFQDFARYLLPARENVGLGRHERVEQLAITASVARQPLRCRPHAAARSLGRLLQRPSLLENPPAIRRRLLGQVRWLACSFIRCPPLELVASTPPASKAARMNQPA